ncbi:ChaN family lipoprotein [Occallatibacter riparius]|uniref:ChaN family lipoprotein n=1 Tax=Occallatibacter riparius TaxID=1002689 RepID=A0A9J7BPU6_9BACT|nr:ChaN family lipoprotein [Occallatibacter riparius]UWZ84803.1 ChaN family lipoprotein [Occallatibacter riparius]
MKGILQALDRYPIVAIGEAHSIEQMGSFYVSLVQNRKLQQNINDIVIEFASQQSQPTLDAYVNGKNVSSQSLRSVWRDTTKVFAWESPIYAQLLSAVRKVNADLPPQKRLRVLAGDCSIDWMHVRNHLDWRRYQPNDTCFADVIKRQVLAKGHRALVILGSAHVSRNSDPSWPPNVTKLVEQAYPNSVFVVLLSFNKPERETEGTPPILLPWPRVSLPGGKEAVVGEYGDAMLYLGTSVSDAEPLWSEYQKDKAYLLELNRRARIQWGCPFNLNLVRDHLPLCRGH